MTLNETRDLLLKHNDFTVLTHRHPDGDTVGSAAALCLALKAAGKRARLFANAEISPKLAPFFAMAPNEGRGRFVVAVDFSTSSQLPEGWKGKVDLFIDHHVENAGESWDGLRDQTAGACGDIILDLCRGMPGEKPKEYYDCLYLAVSTDTGGFKFSNCGEREHRAAAECIAGGCDCAAINKNIFILKSPGRIKNEAEVLGEARLFADGRAAFSRVSLEMKKRSNNDETDNLSSLLMQIEGVRCGVLATENEDGTLRISVRSDAPFNSGELCRAFGGGGHDRAAGCTLRSEDELSKLLSEVERLV